MNDPTRTPQPRRDVTALTGPLSGLAFVTAILGAMRLAKDPFPRPGAPAADVRRYYRDSAGAVRFSAAGQAVSILCLARFARSAARLAAQSPRSPRALQAGLLVSGGVAVASLTASAATHASLTLLRERGDEEIARTARRVFVAGGPVHGVAYGAFIGLLTTAARDVGLLGRPGTATGWVSTAAGVASPAYFRWENAGWLIPIGRFSGYVLSGLVGARLAGLSSAQGRGGR